MPSEVRSMKTLEIEGKTIDEAIEKACREFNVPREKLNIEIITEGASGFLGLVGSKKARIKAGLLSLDMSLDLPPEKTERKPSESAPMKEAPEAKKTGESHLVMAQNVLEGILSKMNVESQVIANETADAILLTIKGAGNGLIIGKRGQTLDAIQYIVNKALNKQGKEKKPVIIDAEDYRKKREESLVAFAEKLGRKVKKTKKAITISHMNARERRIIHMSLQGDEALVTKSRGEGENRKIIIQPGRKGKD
jgi:spoIIIJ-associated protein